MRSSNALHKRALGNTCVAELRQSHTAERLLKPSHPCSPRIGVGDVHDLQLRIMSRPRLYVFSLQNFILQHHPVLAFRLCPRIGGQSFTVLRCQPGLTCDVSQVAAPCQVCLQRILARRKVRYGGIAGLTYSSFLLRGITISFQGFLKF